MNRKRWTVPLSLFFILFLIGCATEDPPETTTISYVPPDVESIYQDSLEEAVRLLNDEYIYAEQLDVDLAALTGRLNTEISATTSPDDFADLLDDFVNSVDIDGLALRSREERIDVVESFPPTFAGIGASFGLREGADARLVILDVIPDSPADRAGIMVRDAILSIDGEPVNAESALDAETSLVDGDSGSEVLLEVRSPGDPPRKISLSREEISPTRTNLNWTFLTDTRVLYVIFSPRERPNLDQQFVGILQTAFETGDIEGLVFDLRTANNGQVSGMGGLLPIFVDGEVGFNVSREDRTPINIQGTVDFMRDASTLPMAVLVGPDTRGVPEIVAGILQDSGRAVLIGQPTPGEIEGLTTYYLPNGTQLSLPTTSVVTAQEGRDLGRNGLEPDLEIDIPFDEVPFATDPVIAGAIEFIQFANISNNQNEG